MKDETLFVKLPQSVKVYDKQVKLKDVAKFHCSNSDLVKELDEVVLLTMDLEKSEQTVVSALKVFQAIQKNAPEVSLTHIGETDVLIRYVRPVKINKALQFIKLFGVCLGAFVGAAFSIMTFNTDVSVSDVFDHIYELFYAVSLKDYHIVEIFYSIGLFSGIMVFYNHFSKKKKWTDPTPIQVEMRNYDNDTNTAIIEEAGRTQREIEK